ncbi:MAG: helicase-exonuclease AddAB subunit AddB [Syntrophomonas sp.]|nr:helicase-exonuclease AddAB subunit AddB [Syntrophomonas sp.]
MAIRFILSRAGQGKSHYIQQEIKKSLQDGGEERLILLVPEQFTLQSERDLIRKLHLPGIMRVEVLSLTRLAQRVFNEAGGLTRTLLNEQGKNMVLRKMIDEVAHDLTIYRKSAQQDGFIIKFSELISELKQQDILPAQLLASMEGEEDLILKQKTHDIAIIYERFNDYLLGNYLDTEDYFNLLIEKIDKASLLQGARVWVDEFNTFSPQSMKIIEKIMLLAQDTTISFSLDANRQARDHDLFVLPWQSYKKIQAMAREHGLTEETIKLDTKNTGLHKSPEILHLETELYAYPHHAYTEAVQNLEIFEAANINSEIEYTAAQILMLVREQGYRFNEMAVVCNNMDTYGSIIKRVFDEYNIPYFMDQKRDIMNNPLIQLILSSLRVIRRGYLYDDVFCFLKTGLSGLRDDDIEKLENHALRFGIQGKSWLEDFCLDDTECGEELNHWRTTLILPLQKLHKQVKGKNSITRITRALYEFLEDISVREQLEQWLERLNQQGRYELVHENTQIWNIVLEIFDQLIEIMGQQEASIKQYERILAAGFESMEVGIIPTTIDQVLVGSIQRSKSHATRGVFVVGVNDGILPSGKEEEGILGEEEKQLLLDKGLDLGFDFNRKLAEERFLIYTALTKPQEYLALSLALSDNEGKALRPSLLIAGIQKLFPALKRKSDVLANRQSDMHKVATPLSSIKFMVENLRLSLDGKPGEEFWWDVYSWYWEQEEWRPECGTIINGLFHNNQTSYIGAESARKLYKMPLHSTVSRLEQFVRCPFAHFVRYGLKPQERKVFAVGAPDMGEIFHNCLQSFALKLREEKVEWAQIQRPECERIVDSIIDEITPEYGHGVLLSNHRYRYLIKKLKRISRRAVWTLTAHLQNGDFKPLDFEVSFGPGCTLPAIEVELGNGEKFYIVGRIDRVDLLDEEDNTFVKIIDYKSGYQKFSLSDVYFGLSLQLIIYLQSVLISRQHLKRSHLIPAGIFYFKIDDPLVNSESRIVETIEKEIAKKLKMTGVALKDVELVRRLDRQIDNYSDILPVALTKDENFAKSSSVLALDEFWSLINHVETLLQKIGGEIIAGKVKIEPVNDSRRNACEFCPYQPVCQFDRLFKDNNFRNIRPLQEEEIIARLSGLKEVTPVERMD